MYGQNFERVIGGVYYLAPGSGKYLDSHKTLSMAYIPHYTSICLFLNFLGRSTPHNRRKCEAESFREYQ